MDKMVFLYRLPNIPLSLCDMKSLTKSCWELVSGWSVTTFSTMFYWYKVAKNIFCANFNAYLWPNLQNTVWNIAKRHCVTFCKFIRMFPFFYNLLIGWSYLLFLSVVKSSVKEGSLIPCCPRVPITEISEI